MMKNSIREYINDCIEHDVLFELFGNELFQTVKEDYINMRDEIGGILEEFGYIVSRAEANKAVSRINAFISSFTEKLNKLLKKTAGEIAEKESDFLKSVIYAYFGINLVIPKRTKSVIPLAPYSSQNSIDTLTERLEEKLKASYKNPVMTEYVMGSSINDVKETIVASERNIEQDLETEVRNVATGTQRQTRNYIFLKNSLKMSYVWNAILDSSTCLVCGEMHGKRFKSITEVPVIPPVHLNCRCSVIGVPEKEDVEIPSYSEWLDSQDEEIQKKILGATRYRLYKNGYSVDKFINNGKKLTLDEVYKNNKK